MVQKISYYEKNRSKVLEKNKLKRQQYLKEKEKVLNDYKLKYPNLNYLRVSDYEKYEAKQNKDKKVKIEEEEDDNMSFDTDYFDEMLDDVENKDELMQTYEINLKGLDDLENINENNFIKDVINAKICIKDNWIVINGNLLFLDSFLRLSKVIEDYVNNK